MEMDKIVQMLWGFAGGAVSCLLILGILSLKLWRLQFAVGALQQAVLALRNTNANQSRQTKKQEMEEFFSRQVQPSNERYANDPPAWR